ncbi:hypothetical protein VP01_7662g1, partial [Puccinia sorghi]
MTDGTPIDHHPTQNEMIASLSAQVPPHAPADKSYSDNVMRQFIKSLIKFYREVNPRKPTLLFDGSNY